MNNQTITDQDTVDTWPEAEDWSRWEQPLRERVLNWLRWRVFVAELLARWAFRWEHSRRLGTIGGVEIQLHNVWLFFTPFRCPIDERGDCASSCAPKPRRPR